MKKLMLFLIQLFFTAQVFAALPTSASDYAVTVPLFNGGFEAGVAGLFLLPSTADETYALVYPFVEGEGGRYKSNRPNVDFGYQFYLGYMFPCSGNNIRLSYLEYYQKENDHVGAPEGVLLPNFSGFTVTVPPVAGDVLFFVDGNLIETLEITLIPAATLPLTQSVTQADSRETFKLQVIDLDLGQYVDVDNFYRFRFFAGLRYSHVKNNLDVHYLVDFTASETSVQGPFNITLPLGDPIGLVNVISTLTLSSPTATDFFFLQSSDFEGLGPRIGMEGSFHLGGGFGLVGSVSSALLVGHQRDKLLKGNNDIILTSSFEGTVELLNPDPPANTTTEVINETLPDGTVFVVSTGGEAEVSTGRINRIVPNIDARIGINYTYPFNGNACRNFNIEVGYYVNHFFDAIDRISESTFNSPDIAGYKTMDANFNGPYVAVQLNL